MPSVPGGQPEEIANQLLAEVRAHGFRMELHAKLRTRLVLHRHHDSINSRGRCRQACRQRITLNAEGVVAHHVEAGGDIAEQIAAIMRDPRNAAVHGDGSRNNPRPVRVPDTLMA